MSTHRRRVTSRKRLTVWVFVPQLVAIILFVAAGAVVSAEVVQVGKGNYRTDLPGDASGDVRRRMQATPLVSDRMTGAVPTNDWWSSLVWPVQSPHSLPMFAHPLAVQAHADGLGIGYTAEPMISHSYHEGNRFQSGTSYKYPYRESLRVGLAGVTSDDCVLDAHSDWAVTALWKSGSDELRATFAHGSPFAYFQRESEKPIRVDFKAFRVDSHEQPIHPLTYERTGITAKHSGKPGEIRLSVNAGEDVGIGSKARLVYDFDGDGEIDRIEVFGLFATDPVANSWEVYASDTHPLDEARSHGEFRDFENGSVRLEFWKCFGDGSLQLQHQQSSVDLPIDDGKVFLAQRGRFAAAGDDTTGNLEANDAAATAGHVFYRDDHVIGVTVNQTHYGLFAPSGSSWDPGGSDVDAMSSDLGGKDYLSVAVLPDSTDATIRWFQQFAYAFLGDTRVTYRYDPGESRVTTTYTATTAPKQGGNGETLFALYRHQHLHITEPSRLTEHRYASPRGEMRVVSGRSFQTSTPYLGVLPAVPNAPGSEKDLRAMVTAFHDEVALRERTFVRNDTYWNGKELGKFSEVIQIADQLGMDAARENLVRMLKRRLEDWFDGQAKRFFYYDPTWSTLVGYPDSYGSADQLNDHHFHYSYFIKAAATIARFDSDWAKPENYGGMIELLIRDCANHDRSDMRFPWMRNFDPYAGHSWASGHAGFASGNNQESSSESMNFATSLILYGQATGNDRIRDLGIYWHATEAEAIRNYWFDIDEAVFPVGYEHSCVGIVWGDGGTYGTWWTANPEEIHGINYLPLGGGSLYLGQDPAYVLRNYQNMLASNRRFHRAGFDGDADRLDRWHDVLRQYLAFADAKRAELRYDQHGLDLESEFGETKLHTRQWLQSLRWLGRFDRSTRANHPTAAVFVSQGTKTYVVDNADGAPRTVRFSDGVKVNAPPGLHAFPDPRGNVD